MQVKCCFMGVNRLFLTSPACCTTCDCLMCLRYIAFHLRRVLRTFGRRRRRRRRGRRRVTPVSTHASRTVHSTHLTPHTTHHKLHTGSFPLPSPLFSLLRTKDWTISHVPNSVQQSTVRKRGGAEINPVNYHDFPPRRVRPTRAFAGVQSHDGTPVPK